jgi:trehalose utilization protein
MRLLACVLAFVWACPAVPAQDEAKPVVLDLSKFKGPAENAELFGFNDGEGKVFFFTAGVIEFPAKIVADGDYQIVVKASCDEAMNQKAKFKLRVDGQQVGAETTLTAVEEKEYVLAATLKAGDRKIGLEFTNDLYKENEYDLNFYVHGVTVRPAK